jgi:hypothetical protein
MPATAALTTRDYVRHGSLFGVRDSETGVIQTSLLCGG